MNFIVMFFSLKVKKSQVALMPLPVHYLNRYLVTCFGFSSFFLDMDVGFPRHHA